MHPAGPRRARDLIGQAKTGTGKTLGFGIPLLQRMVVPANPEYADLPADAQGKPQALVVCPTRELGLQVATDIERAGRLKGVRVLAIYGGRAYEPQIEALQNGIDVDRRHARSHHRPRQPTRPRPVARAACSSSTRPTRCSTWASCPTSSASSR